MTKQEKQAADNKRYRERYPGLERKRRQLKRQSDPLHWRLIASKSCAKQRGIEFSITREDLGALPSHCPILGIELNYVNCKRQDDSASIDRIDNSKGYVPGNVQIICWRANNLKGSATFDELKLIAQWTAKQDV